MVERSKTVRPAARAPRPRREHGALEARTRELDLIQSLSRLCAEAHSPEQLFRAAVSVLQRAEPLDLALAAGEFSAGREVLCFRARPFEESALRRVVRLSGRLLDWPEDGPAAPRLRFVDLDDFDAARGPRSDLDERDAVVVPLPRRGRTAACLVFLPAGGAGEAQLRVLYGAANQLGLHLDRILTAREEEADRFRTILDSMPQPVVLTDASLGVVHANRAAGELLRSMGLDPAGRFADAVARLDLSGVVERVRATGAAVADGEARLDGEFRFSVSVSPFRPAGGGPGGLVFVLTDVSESRRLQQRLAQSEKMSSLGQMISGTAHELNNPLSSVLGYVQLLQSSAAGDEKTARRLALVQREAERCQRIVQNLLAFARQRPPERRAVSLNEVVQSVLSLLGYQLRTSGVAVTTELDSSLPSVEGDTHQLQQVLVNLLTNAMHAIRAERDAGRVRVVTSLGRDGAVVAEVHDDGPGVPEPLRSRVFDPFYTTKAEGQGTGLGLSIVYGIVAAHGGSIEALPSVDGGACFRMRLPARAPTAPESLAEAALAVDPSPRPARILVVDDETALAQMLCEALARDGHRVSAAGDGARALERLAGAEFDLVISDMKMPGMDGARLLEEIERRHPALRERVMLTTGDTVSPEPEAFARSKGLELVAKPFDLDDLRRRVRLRLSRARGEA